MPRGRTRDEICANQESTQTSRDEQSQRPSPSELAAKNTKGSPKGCQSYRSILLSGRGGEIRTPDPLFPKQMRYQAALRPEPWRVFSFIKMI